MMPWRHGDWDPDPFRRRGYVVVQTRAAKRRREAVARANAAAMARVYAACQQAPAGLTPGARSVPVT